MTLLPIITAPIDMQCDHESESPSFRWPAHVAKEMADSIHQKVFATLSNSRLVRQLDGVQLVQRDDILQVDKLLGSGAFSRVSSVITRDGRRYARKSLKQKLMEQPEHFRLAAAELACEAHMLASFDHPHILKIRGWTQNGIAAFEDGRHDSFFLLLDLLDETLDTRIDRWLANEEQATCSALLVQAAAASPQHSSGLVDLRRRLGCASSTPAMNPAISAEDHQHLLEMKYQSQHLEKLQIMIDIASALDYIHKRGVIYRDLKPNNIGFIGNHVQLFDFGLSRELPTLDTTFPFKMSGKVGTLRYMAPEVAAHQPYNIPADVYSFAMVSFEMLSLQKPFDGWTRSMHSELVCGRGMRPDTTNSVQVIPLNMRIMLEHLWHAIPCQRPAVPQIISQLQVIKDQQLHMMNEQELRRQLSRQLEVEAHRQAQQEAAAVIATAMYVDMSYYLAAGAPPRKLYRNRSSDSMGTIETTALSADSIDF